MIRGAAALAEAIPAFEQEPSYGCPQCLDVFVRSSIETGELTAEHVPPKSLGGKALILTCRTCNNTSGSQIEAHARKRENLLEHREALEGGRGKTRPTRVRVQGSDYTVAATLQSVDRYVVFLPRGRDTTFYERFYRAVRGKGRTSRGKRSKDQAHRVGMARMPVLRNHRAR